MAILKLVCENFLIKAKINHYFYHIRIVKWLGLDKVYCQPKN